MTALALALLATARPAAAEGGSIEIQVTGERGSPAGKRDPSGASYVIREDRLRAPGSSAADVIAAAPGVQVARTGASSDLATASIRGATSAQMPVYLAGVRLNDDVTGTADLSLVPLWMIQRVEIYRSGAPPEADRMGIGGAIFFEPILPRSTRVGAGLGAGSFGELSTWAAGAAGDERAGVMLAVRRQSAANDYPYLDDRGTRFDPGDDVVRRRPNADYTAYDAFGVARARVGRVRVTAIVNGLYREQGVTGLSVVPARAARGAVRRWLGAVTAAAPCSAGDGGERCEVELTSAALLTGSVIRDPEGELALLSPLVASEGSRVSERARVRYRLGDRVTLRLAVSQEIEVLRIDAPASPLLRARRAATQATVAAVAQVIPRLELNAAAAVQYHATGASGSSVERPAVASAAEPTARAGARVRVIDGVDLLANVGRYARVPTLGELYGTSAIVRGNPDVSPERGVSADLGARVAIARPSFELWAEAFGFARLASDLIGFRRSSLGVVRPYNVASARVLGAEIAAGADLFRHVRAEIALTALDPRDVSAGRALGSDLIPFQARLVASPSIEVYAGPLRAIALDRASVGARLSYRASRVADPAGLVVIPEQATVDADLALLFWKGRIAARLAVLDVANAARFDVVGLPLPGRSVHGSMEVWWW